MQLKTMDDVFEHELKDLYSAEKQLVEALPKMAKATSNAKLKTAIEKHLEVTQMQLQRVEEIGKSLGSSVTGHTCEGMKGLIKEGEGLIKDSDKGDALDAALIGAAQRIEHYEIAAYGTVRAFARRLGLDDVAQTLQQTLDEEGQTDKLLTQIAESSVNMQAAV